MAKFSLSSLHTFVSGLEDQPFWVGIDVHKRSYYIALRRFDGRCATWVTPADPDTFAEQVFRLGIAVAAVAYESGPTGFVLARTLERAHIPVIVAAASRIPRSVTAGAKCDRLDCVKLADYAAKGMLGRLPYQRRKRKLAVHYCAGGIPWSTRFDAASRESRACCYFLGFRNPLR